MSPLTQLLERPHARGHFVQLYEMDGLSPVNNLGLYLWEGLKRGDGVLLVATRERRASLCGQLAEWGVDTQSALWSRQLVFFDARSVLDRIMDGGQPNWWQFESAVGTAIQETRPTSGEAGLRVYGEMVGILWKAWQFAAAIQLEQFWNKLLERSSFSLYCGYALDIFGEEFQADFLNAVLCAHTHLVPAQPNGSLDTALSLAMNEVLGENAEGLRQRIGTDRNPSWAVMPGAEATIFWLKNNIPGQAKDIVARSRDHYRRLASGASLLHLQSVQEA